MFHLKANVLRLLHLLVHHLLLLLQAILIVVVNSHVMVSLAWIMCQIFVTVAHRAWWTWLACALLNNVALAVDLLNWLLAIHILSTVLALPWEVIIQWMTSICSTICHCAAEVLQLLGIGQLFIVDQSGWLTIRHGLILLNWLPV